MTTADPDGKAEPAHDALHLPHHAIIREAARWPLALLVLAGLVLASLGAWAINRALRPADAHPGLTIDIGPPPVVEPMVLKPIAPDVARAENAAQPFVAGLIPPAPPFRLSAATPADAERATDCLAANIFYEAGNEHLEGQMAVAQVVLNRVRHPAFPKTVCGVVFQGSERRTGCQFSFTCDRSLARRPSPDAWQRYRALAASMLAGAVHDPVGLATHYHTDWVRPVWSTRMDKLTAERTHLFFRWTGYWGSSRAFTGRHPGTEPSIPAMAALSPAHGSTDAPLADVMAGLAAEGTPPIADPLKPVAALPPVTAEERAQNSFFIRIDKASDPALLADLAARTCGPRPYCKLIAWTDPALLPAGTEMTDAQRGSIAFSFLRNREQGFEKPLWNCTLFPRADKRQCIRGTAAGR